MLIPVALNGCGERSGSQHLTERTFGRRLRLFAVDFFRGLPFGVAEILYVHISSRRAVLSARLMVSGDHTDKT